MDIDETMTAQNGFSGLSEIGGASGSQPQSAPQFLPKGFVTCPYCNHVDQIQLVDVYTAVDPKVDPTGELPNTYVVSILKCKDCGLTFDLPRVDVRFGKGE